MNMLFVHGMDAAYEQYNVKYYSKHKIVFLDTCLIYPYLPPDWLGQYLGTYHNKGTYIYSAILHDVQRYRDTLFQWPCLLRYCKYDIPMRSYCILIDFKNMTGYFTIPSVLCIVTYIFEVFHMKIDPC